MSEDRQYYVYFMASDSGTLYVGVSGHLEGRVQQHKDGKIEGFTKKYKCYKLVYFEEFDDIEQAILRETQIKKWRREKKEALIKKMNPMWRDLSQDWKVKPSRRDSSTTSDYKNAQQSDSARNDKKKL
jgi:putative endonuclease